MFSKRILILFVTLVSHSAPGFAQQVITVDELINLALRESPLRKAAALQTLRQETLVRKASMLPDPELIIESPTGDFYVAGVEQTFEFPTVYSRQKQVARQQIQVAADEEATVDRQIRLHVREHYLEWQYAMARFEFCKTRDSIYQQIKVLSERQFDAGEIDAVEKTLAMVKYAEAHAKMLQAGADVHVVRTRLEPFASGLEQMTPMPLQQEAETTIESWMTLSDSVFLMQNWMLNKYRIAETLAGKEIQLEKAKRLPDFRVGYLNQGISNIPFVMGMRLGISVPLPTGAYKSSIQAAELELDRIGEQQNQAVQDIRTEWHQAQANLERSRKTLEFLKANGLPSADELIRTGRRMYEAGQYDLIRLFTMMTESFTLREMYLENWVQYHRITIQLHYLNGTI